MDFELIDRYLLDGKPAKADVVAQLLTSPSNVPAAKPFYEGMKMLGPRTPDLTLIALRLVLSGRKAEDTAVVQLRDYVEQVHAGGPEADQARAAYREALA